MSLRNTDSSQLVHFNELQKVLIDEYVPTAVLIDENLNIVYHSGDTSPYLKMPEGSGPTHHLLKQAQPNLGVHLSSIIRKAKAEKSDQVLFIGNQVNKENVTPSVNIRIRFVNEDKTAAGGIIVIFEADQSEQVSNRQPRPSQLPSQGVDFEEELKVATQELQVALEESSTVNAELQIKIAELKSARNDVENLLLGTRLPIIVVNKDLEIRHFSSESADIFHIIPSDLGRPLQHIVSKLLLNKALSDICQSVLDSLTAVEQEVNSEDGRYFLMRIYPYMTSAKSSDGVVLTFLDITEIKLAQAKLQANKEDLEGLVREKTQYLKDSQELLEEAGRMANIGGWELDVETKQLTWTEQTHRIHDLEDQPIPDLDAAIQFYHAEDQPVVASLVQECIKNGTPFDGGFRFITAKGRHLWVRVRGQKRDRLGKQYLVGTITDITARKVAELALQKTSEQMKEAQAIAHVGNWEWDIGKDEIKWSDELYRIMVFDLSEPTPSIEEILEMHHPDDRETVGRAVKEAIEEGKPYEIESRILPRDGSEKVILVKCRIKKNLAGETSHLYGTVLDTTEYRASEQRLKVLHQSLLDVLESTQSGFIALDKNYVVTYMNQTGLDALSIKASDILGKNLWSVFTSPDSDQFKKYYDLAFSHQRPVNFEEFFEPLNEWFEVHVYPTPDSLSVYFRIITEQKKLQDRVRHSEKMDAIGHLAGGVAHDFNNQLTGVLGFADLLVQQLSDPHLRQYAENICAAAQHSKDLTMKLLAFSRKGKFQSVPIDVHKVILETIDVLVHTIDKRICIKQEFSAGKAMISGDPSAIQNALLNVCLNARDAMPEGGMLEITTQVVNIDDTFRASNSLDLEAGNYITISVADTGDGIPEEVMPHIFEPFYTTKAEGRGTGMGLAAVYGTVKKHEGDISIQSKAGEGTCVKFFLPLRSSGIEETVNEKEEEKENASKSLRVLVVDDEHLIRTFECQLFSRLGHTVHSATNGQEAVDLYREQWQTIDLVILDMIMPKMNGKDAFREMKAINPKVKVILASGYSIDDEAQSVLDEGAAGFVQKPFSVAALMSEIKRALSEDDASQ